MGGGLLKGLGMERAPFEVFQVDPSSKDNSICWGQAETRVRLSVGGSTSRRHCGG